MREIIMPDMAELDEERREAMATFQDRFAANPNSVIDAISNSLAKTIDPEGPLKDNYVAVNHLIETSADIKITSDEETEAEAIKAYGEYGTRPEKRLARLLVLLTVKRELSEAEKAGSSKSKSTNSSVKATRVTANPRASRSHDSTRKGRVHKSTTPA